MSSGLALVEKLFVPFSVANFPKCSIISSRPFSFLNMSSSLFISTAHASLLPSLSYAQSRVPPYIATMVSSARPTRMDRFRSFCTPPSADEAVIEATSTAADVIGMKNAANLLDIRVGRILKAWRHEEADSLYVEEVDVGEPEPRIICSGLVNYIPLDHLQDKQVIVLANLKARNMRGVKSHGMLMAASDTSHENVELLEPPMGANPGERIWFGTEDDKENLPAPATPNQIQKKKIWETVQPHLKTDASCNAMLGVHAMRGPAGVVVCRSLNNANIS